MRTEAYQPCARTECILRTLGRRLSYIASLPMVFVRIKMPGIAHAYYAAPGHVDKRKFRKS